MTTSASSASVDDETLLNQLTYKYEYGEDPGEVFRLPEFYERITPAAVRDAAQMYLDTSRYVRVTLLPER